MLGPAYRGFIQQVAKRDGQSTFRVGFDAHFDWEYRRGMEPMRRLYEAAKRFQEVSAAAMPLRSSYLMTQLARGSSCSAPLSAPAKRRRL